MANNNLRPHYAPRNSSLEIRLAARSEKQPNGCITWTGQICAKGYGFLSWQGKMVKAHRMAWEVANGPIPPGGHICHTCDNRSCLNPAHLWVGTNAQNQADRNDKDRQAKGRRIHNAKLTPEAVRAIRADGRSNKVVAATLGVAPSTVHFVRSGKTWGHVK